VRGRNEVGKRGEVTAGMGPPPAPRLDSFFSCSGYAETKPLALPTSSTTVAGRWTRARPPSLWSEWWWEPNKPPPYGGWSGLWVPRVSLVNSSAVAFVFDRETRLQNGVETGERPGRWARRAGDRPTGGCVIAAPISTSPT
jgi:hypothetical protein